MPDGTGRLREREFFIDNLLVRIHFIIVMIRWTGLASWEFEFGTGRLNPYRGTSLIRNSAPLGSYSRPVPRALWWP